MQSAIGPCNLQCFPRDEFVAGKHITDRLHRRPNVPVDPAVVRRHGERRFESQSSEYRIEKMTAEVAQGGPAAEILPIAPREGMVNARSIIPHGRAPDP